MKKNPGNLERIKTYKGFDKILIGNEQGLQISHIGDTSLKNNHGNLNLKKNLLSISQFIDDNKCSFIFNADGFVVKNKQNQILAKGRRQRKLYVLEEAYNAALSAIRENLEDHSLWHKRLGHAISTILYALKKNRNINFPSWTKQPNLCVSCQLGKNCKQTFKLSNNKSKFPLECIHCDLWGSSPIASTQNYHFYALFVDDFTRFSWLFPLKNKSNFFECFLRFQRQVNN